MADDTFAMMNRETGKVEAVPVLDAKALYLSGKYGLLKGSLLPFDPGSGVLKYVRAEDAGQVFRNSLPDWRVATREQAEEARKERTYGAGSALALGFGKGAMGAVGAPFNRMALLEAQKSDAFRHVVDPYAGPAVSTPTGRVREWMTEAPRLAPLSHGAGELAGWTAMSMGTGLSGGLGGVARGALGKVAGTVATGAGEAALMGVVDADNEAAVTGETLTAEKMMAAGASHALFGGTFALGGMALEHGAAAAWKPMGSLMRKAFGQDAVGEAAGLAPRSLEESRAILNRGVRGRNAADVGIELSEAGREVRELNRAGIQAHEGDLNARMMDGTSAAAHDSRGLTKVWNDLDARRRWAQDELGELAKRPGQAERSAKALQRYQEVVEPVADRMRSAVQEYDAAALELRDANAAFERERRLVTNADIQAAKLEVAEARSALKDAELVAANKEASRTVASREARGMPSAGRFSRDAELGAPGRGKDERWDAAKTQVRKELGSEEAAQVVLGHRDELRAAERRLERLKEGQMVGSEESVAAAQARLREAESRMARADHPHVNDFRTKLVDLEHAKKQLDPSSPESIHNFIEETRRGLRPLQDIEFKRGQNLDARLGDVQVEKSKGWVSDLQKAREALREVSGDERLFGRVGAATKEINALTRAQIQAETEAFGEVARNARSANRPLKIDPEKLLSRLHDTLREGTHGFETTSNADLKKYFEATKSLLRSYEKHGLLAPGKTSAVIRRIERAEAAMFDASTLYAAKNQLDLVNGFAQQPANIRVGLGAAIGAAVAGVPGSILGGAAVTMSKRGQQIAWLSAIERASMRVDEKAGTHLADFFIGRRPRVATKTASASFLAGPGGERATFERMADKVSELAANPQGVQAAVEKALGGAAVEKPGLAFHLAQLLSRAVEHLAVHQPPGLAMDTSLVAPHLEKPTYTDREMRSWARRAAAINDPTSVLQHLRDGTVSPEEVEAVKEVYPELFAKWQYMVITRLGQQTQPLDRAQKMGLALVFDLPTDASLKPETMRILQMIPSGRAGQRGAHSKSTGPMRMMKLGDPSKTLSQQIATR